MSFLASTDLFKRLLLAFWSTWLGLVFLTNLCDALKTLGSLPPDWPFASGNYAFLVATTSVYSPPSWLNALLFAGVIIWEGIAAWCYWFACWTAHDAQHRGLFWRRAACLVTASLWSAFLLAEEVFLAYPVEAVHWRLWIAQLVTLLVLELLPNTAPSKTSTSTFSSSSEGPLP